MATLAQSSTTRATLLEEVEALRVEIDAANRKIHLYNDTIVFQANELTILHNIICRNCKVKFLNAAVASFPSPTLRGRPLPVDFADGPNTASVDAEPTAIIHQDITTCPVSVQEVPNSQLSGRLISSSKAIATTTPFQLKRTPQHAPPSRAIGTASAAPSYSTPRSDPAVSRPVVSFHKSNRPLPTIPLKAIPFDPTTQSSSLHVSPTLSRPPQVTTSPSFERAGIPPSPGQFGKAKTTVAISSVGPSQANPKHNSWSVRRGPKAGKGLDVTFERAFAHRGDLVYCVKFSSDGKYIAFGISRDLDGQWQGFSGGKVLVYSTETGKQACRLVEYAENEQKRSGVRTVYFSPNGKQLAIGHSDGYIRLWQIAKKRVQNIFRHRLPVAVNSLDFSPTGQSIVSASKDTTVVWSVRDGSSKILNDANSLDQCAKFSPDGRYVAAANMSYLRIWDSRSCHLVVKWCRDPVVISSLAFMPDGKELLSGNLNGTVQYWHVGEDTANLIHEFGATPIRKFYSSMAISVAADGQWLLSASSDDTPRLWNVPNGTLEYIFQGHTGRVLSVDICPVGNYLAMGDNEGQVSLWKYKVIRS